MSGIPGFTVSGLNPADYTTQRAADNLAPMHVPQLLKVIKNLGFPDPKVVVGDGIGTVPLDLADYLQRAGEPGTTARTMVDNYPVNLVLCWPEQAPGVSYQAATGFAAFGNDLWFGFGSVAAALRPDVKLDGLRELAIKQMPKLSQAFDKQLRKIALDGVVDTSKEE